MSANVLTTWVCDQLHDVAGISDKAIAEYFVGLAKKSKSAEDLVSKIESTETLTIDPKVRTFANSLYERVPKTSGKEVTSGQKRKSENREKERIAQELELKNKTYGLVQSDEEDTGPTIRPKKKAKKDKKKTKKSHSSDAVSYTHLTLPTKA